MPPDGIEQRVANVIQAYDAQGNHRTGTEVDQKSAEWLAKQVRGLGVEPQHDSLARGETGAVQHGGGRFVTLVCASEVYHNVADRWPEAVDVALMARYARAFANGALELARQTG